MRRIWLSLLVLSASAVLAAGGCMWHVPVAASDQARAYRNMQPPPGKALLYVLRSDALEGGTVLTRVHLDGDGFGTFSGGSFLVVAIEPGKHELRVSLDNTARLSFSARAGERIYLLQGVRVTTGPSFQVWLKQLDATEGQARLKAYRMSLKNDLLPPLK